MCLDKRATVGNRKCFTQVTALHLISLIGSRSPFGDMDAQVSAMTVI